MHKNYSRKVPLPPVPPGSPYLSLVIPGYPWLSLVIPGYHLLSLVITCYPWLSLVIHVYSWFLWFALIQIYVIWPPSSDRPRSSATKRNIVVKNNITLGFLWLYIYVLCKSPRISWKLFIKKKTLGYTKIRVKFNYKN